VTERQRGHTATHCNTLQRTTTHCSDRKTHFSPELCEILAATHCCNTLQPLLQHTATHCCNALQHIAATHCNTLLQHMATHCSDRKTHIFPQLGEITPATRCCNTLQHSTTHCSYSITHLLPELCEIIGTGGKGRCRGTAA